MADMDNPAVKLVEDNCYVVQDSSSRHESFSSSASGNTEDYHRVAAEAAVTAAAVAAVNDMVGFTQDIWPANHQVVHPLDSALMLNAWDPDTFATVKTEEWDFSTVQHQQPQQQITEESNYTLSNIMPIKPESYAAMNYNISSAPPSVANTALSTPNSDFVTPSINYFHADHKVVKKSQNRRSSSADVTPTKRPSSQPSVASVVSLTAHEPISRIVDGIEYITFLYSHDRLVKEYTVRTDVDHVDLDDILMDFRIQNAIYPRANVERTEYDGNRWDYETTCNQLGWKLCHLNKEQLFGRRGLIQRAVDSYRNRHAEMRSRRVTRQEKLANGTLRKRRSKKALSTAHII